MRKAWRFVRAVWRAFLLGGVFVFATADFLLMAGPWAGLPRRTRWLRRWSRRTLRLIGFRVQHTGRPPPSHGVVVSNHLGYLDVLVFASISPQVFLSTTEVRRWPVIGKFAEWAGCEFIERGRRADVARQNAGFLPIVARDAVLTLFLEGTSSDGSQVLPFRSSLLEPAVQHKWPVTTAAIRYTCVGGDPGLTICWWGDMTFLDHLFGIFLLDAAVAYVIFGDTTVARGDRKLLAARLREEVVALKGELDRPAAPGANA